MRGACAGVGQAIDRRALVDLSRGVVQRAPEPAALLDSVALSG